VTRMTSQMVALDRPWTALRYGESVLRDPRSLFRGTKGTWDASLFPDGMLTRDGASTLQKLNEIWVNRSSSLYG
jgi:hypothetical protein